MRKTISILAIAAVAVFGVLGSNSRTFAASQPTLQSSSISASQIGSGQNVNFSAVIMGGNHDQSVLVDTEVKDASGNKVLQNFSDNQNIAANATQTFNFTGGSGLPSGNYSFSVGIFNPGWNGLLSWTDNVKSFTVGSGTGGGTTGTTTITFTNGYPMLNGNFIDCNGNIDNDPAHHATNPADTDPGHHVGQNCPAGSFVATNGGSNGTGGNNGGGNGNGTTDNSAVVLAPLPTQATPGHAVIGFQNTDKNNSHTVLVDLEAYASDGHRVMQNFFDNENFTANQIKTYTMDLTAQPAGTYRVAAGVFNTGWNGLLHWYNDAAQVTVGGNNNGGNQISAHLVQGNFSGAAFEVIVSDSDTNQITNSQLKMTLTKGSTVLTKTVPPSNIITDSSTTSQGQTFSCPCATYFWSVAPGSPAPADGTYTLNAALLNNSNATIQSFDLGSITIGASNTGGGNSGGQTPVTAGAYTAQLFPGSERSFLKITLSSTSPAAMTNTALKVQILDNDGNVATENILTAVAGSPVTANGVTTSTFIWSIVPQPCDNNLALTGTAAPVKVWVIDQTTEVTKQAMGTIGTAQTNQGPIGSLACVAMDSSSVDPIAITSGQTATMTATFTNHAETSQTAKIVLSLRDSTGAIVASQTFDNQAFAPNDTKTFQFTTPNNLATGDYHFVARVYLFGDLIHSYDPAGALTVNGGTADQSPFKVISSGFFPGPQTFSQEGGSFSVTLDKNNSTAPTNVAVKISAVDSSGEATVLRSIDNVFPGSLDAFITQNQLKPESYHFKLDIYNPGFNGLIQTFDNLRPFTINPLNVPLAAQFSDFDFSHIIIDRSAYEVMLVVQQAQTLRDLSKVQIDLVRDDGSVAETTTYDVAPHLFSNDQLSTVFDRFSGQGAPALPQGTFKVNVKVFRSDGTTQDLGTIGSATFPEAPL